MHDAANILRRYFNQLPEPIIPLNFYDRFRDPLRHHQAQAVGEMDGQRPSQGHFDIDHAIRTYQQLITELPPLNRQLLLYILDLLAVFASKSDMNKMTTQNLAAIFQPGLLSHPSHDMAPVEYRLSQDVLIFLIENQDSFLIGMQGTAADAKTVQEVQSGPPTPQQKQPSTPSRLKGAMLGRSGSVSSAGADSVRKYGGVRRNVSVSSRNSRNSVAAPSPVTSSFTATSPGSGIGVHRSNTVPSKKSPAVTGSRFGRERPSDPSTPTSRASAQNIAIATPEGKPQPDLATDTELTPKQPASPQAISPSSSEATPVATTPAMVSLGAQMAEASVQHEQSQPLPQPVESASAQEQQLPLRPQPEELKQPPHQARDFQPMQPTQPMQPSQQGQPVQSEPGKDAEANSAAPASPLTPAARTFTAIFQKTPPGDEVKKDGRRPNKLQKKRLPGVNPSAHSSAASLTGHGPSVGDAPPSPLPPGMASGAAKEPPVHIGHGTTPSQGTGATLKPSMSPTHSYRSHSTVTDMSEVEQLDDNATPTESPEKRKHRWRRSKQELDRPSKPNTDPNMGNNEAAGHSMLSFGSSGGPPRKSFNTERGQAPSEGSGGAGSTRDLIHPDSVGAQSEKKKGPIDWFRGKVAERKEKDAEKRTKSPEGKREPNASLAHQINPDHVPPRGKSMDVQRSATDPARQMPGTRQPMPQQMPQQMQQSTQQPTSQPASSTEPTSSADATKPEA